MATTYYMYRHVRDDTNEPFYIGIGVKRGGNVSKWSNEYVRAYRKGRDRSKWWRNIVNKTTYDVDILYESDNLDLIKEKEIEFIKLYGRSDRGKGSLVNLTDGGNGRFGYKNTEKWKQIMSERNSGEKNPFYGRKHSEDSKNKISENKITATIEVICPDGDTFIMKGLQNVCNELNGRYGIKFRKCGVSKACLGKRKQYKKFKFRYV